MPDEQADTADVIAMDGKLFAIIGGVHVPLQFSREAKAAFQKSLSPKPTTKTAAAAVTRPASTWTPPADPVADAATAAASRFDDEPNIRRAYGLELGRKPGDPEYDSAFHRHVAAARRRALRK